MDTPLLIATRNQGKVREFGEMLAGGGAFTDLSKFPDAPEVDETGRTFRDNACLKASQLAAHTKLWTLADDSGLAVDALNGGPGVFSARWAARHDAGSGDAANNALLLRQLDPVPDDQRTARFVCCLALASPAGDIVLTAQDTVEGLILRAPRGHNGFGYDPLFFFPQLGKTTAECAPEEKHAISHRGKALRRMQALMREAGLL
jgi:XTP/dITP diphosphohydrolase